MFIELKTSVLAYKFWLGDVGQWQALSTMVFTHLMWVVRIFEPAPEYEMQNHPSHVHINYRVYAMVVQH